MRVHYNGDEPIYPSDFLDDIINKNSNYTVTFLGNYKPPQQSKEVDLYFVDYHKDSVNGLVNAIYQFGDYGGDYGSGAEFMYSAVERKDSNSPYAEVYKRAIKAGLLKEREVLIGYSSKLKHKRFDSYHIFKNITEAKDLCPSPDVGVFRRAKVVNEEHLEHIARTQNFSGQVLRNQDILRAKNQFTSLRNIISEVNKAIGPVMTSITLDKTDKSIEHTELITLALTAIKDDLKETSVTAFGRDFKHETHERLVNLGLKAETVNRQIDELHRLNGKIMDSNPEDEGYDVAEYSSIAKKVETAKKEILDSINQYNIDAKHLRKRVDELDAEAQATFG